MCTLAPAVLPLIVIRPDFGMSPFAWLFSTATSNECVGDEVSGFMLTDIDLRLERDLIEWAIDFERFCDHPRFNWPAFHGEGRLLAKRLHIELGGQYAVRYVKPWAAPDRNPDSP